MTKEELEFENAELRRQLAEAEEALAAIRTGQVDAIVVESATGAQVFSLSNAETVYRLTIETMAEAAINVTPDGTILFCNARFSELLGTPHELLLGRDLDDFVPPEDRDSFRELFAQCLRQPVKRRVVFRSACGALKPTHLSGRAMTHGDETSLCLVAADLRELESSAQQIEQLRQHQVELHESRRAAFNMMQDAQEARQQAEQAAAALADAHRQVQDLIDNTTANVYACDLEERFVLANAALAALLETTPTQMIGKRRHEFMPQADADAHEAADRKVIAAGRAVEFEEHSDLHGRSITWLSTKFPLRDGQGRIYAVAGIVTDITERKNYEENISRLNLLLDTITSSAKLIIATIDKDYRFTYFNKEHQENIQRITGKENLIGMSLPELFAELPEQQRLSQELWARVLSGETIDQVVEFGPEHYRRFYQTRHVPIVDETGMVVGAGEVSNDITELRKTEEALRASEERYRHLFETMHEGFSIQEIIIDEHGRPCDYRFLSLNPAFERMTGIKCKEAIGKRVLEVIPNLEPVWIERYGQVVLTGEPARFENYVAALGHWYEVLAYRNTPGQFAVIFTDITERKRSEEKLNRSSARLDLLAETASKLLISDSPQEVVNQLCRKVMDFLDCQVFFNFLVDSKEGRLHLNAYAGIPEDEAKRIEWLDYGVAVCGCAAEQGCRIIAEDISNTPDPRTALVKSYGAQAYACHPLMAQGKVLGTLSFGTRTRTSFSDDELAMMKTVADHVSIAINRKHIEEALKASEYRWQTTIDNMLDPVTVCDAEGRVNYINNAYQQLIDRPLAEGLDIEGHADYYQLYNPDGTLFRAEELPLQKAALTGKEVRDVEIVQRSASGREFTAIFSAAPLKDADGNITGAVAVGRDITDLRIAERSLKKSRMDMKAILDNLPFIAWIKDREGRYQMVNKPFANACGCQTPEELVGKTDFDLWPESIARNYRSVDLDVMASGERKVLEERSVLEGEEKWIETSKAPLFDLLGNVIGTTGVSKDITERKIAAEILQKSHDELERLVKERTIDLASTVNALLDEAAIRESVEQSLQRLNLLYAVLSETDHAIVRAKEQESLFNQCCRIAVEHGSFLLAWIGMIEDGEELQIVAAHGSTGYLEDIRITTDHAATGLGPTGIAIREGGIRICNDFLNDPCTIPWQERGRAHDIRSSASIALKRKGKTVGAMTLYSNEKDFFDHEQEQLLMQIGEEISFALDNFLLETQRMEAEASFHLEAEQRLLAMEDLRDKEQMLLLQGRQAAMGEMIGNIAHQWRQPLNNLGLILQELPLCHESGELDKEYLEKSIERSMQMITHMSQTIDGFRNFFRPDKEKVTFPAIEVVEKTLSLLEGTFREQRIFCEVENLDEIHINGYPNEFSQVLLNILNNSKDAFVERNIESRQLRIKLSKEGERSVLAIADNAGGIPDDIIERIFDPYFSTKGPDKGTGIGLFLSKTIIEKNMHGTLWGHNIPGGAEFRIEF